MRNHRNSFLNHFLGLHTFQTFDDTSKKRTSLARILHGTIEQHADTLEKLNMAGAGVYLTINETDGKGRSKANIQRIRASFIDLDGGIPPDEAMKFKPHLVVESSAGKYHCYWQVCDMPPEAFGQMQETLAEKFGGDKAVKDMSRVMRMPGFYHMKGKPFASKIIYENYNFIFTYAEMLDMFPPKPVKQWSAPKYQERKSEDGDFRGQYGAGEGNRNNHIARRIGGAIKRGLNWTDVETEAMLESQACNPPLPEHETRAILASMRRYS